MHDPKGEGGVVSIFVDKLLKNEAPFIFENDEWKREYIYVRYIAKANILALEKGDNEIISSSINIATTINELFRIMRDVAGNNVKVIHKEVRKGYFIYSYLENGRAKEILKWKPEFDLETGIGDTMVYYMELYGTIWYRERGCSMSLNLII